jgi:nitric oxide reductase NorD protein
MSKEQFEDRLWSIIPPDYLNEWEQEEIVSLVAGFDRRLDDLIFQQIAAIWPVSTALCFSILEELDKTLQRIAPDEVPEWVRMILEIFEADGLRAARSFMADRDNIYFQRIGGQGSLLFEEVSARLLPYVRGLANKNLLLEPGPSVSTNTATVFLPREISSFGDELQNFLFYKLIATFQWAFIEIDLYCQTTDNYIDLCSSLAQRYNTTPVSGEIIVSHFFSCFPQPDLAQEIYCLLQTVRAASSLKDHLPGLMGDAQGIFNHLASLEQAARPIEEPATVIDKIRYWLLRFCAGMAIPDVDKELADVLMKMQTLSSASIDAMLATSLVYELCCKVDVGHVLHDPFIFQGDFHPAAAHRARLARREENRTQFVEALASLFFPGADKADSAGAEGEDQPSQQADTPDSGITLMQFEQGKEEEQQGVGETRYIRLEDQDLEVPEDIHELAREISNDMGGIPSAYIDSAQKMAGSGNFHHGTQSGEAGAEVTAGEKIYDEWDFRRQGFRKNWCHLIEKKVTPTKGTFVSATLEKYRGQIIQLKRQFEMMRTQHRFIKRQRDGDDIDIEALTDALGDSRAGQAPSDRLFVRLHRDERDIATLFLVDMSSSTEGWVGNALKESLIILCEALESLGDRYAIYGFSGMRRTRSIVFHVKDFEEAYTDEIKGRIAAISPVDYTRMGAPIRHFTQLLAHVDAKVRLLLILTDGKPEDYDDYKGEYAIEDTRHALIEAKSAGIHPFCITIDREAQDYMAHMFGEINYAFINDVKKLPLRVPEIYRTLTS